LGAEDVVAFPHPPPRFDDDDDDDDEGVGQQHVVVDKVTVVRMI